MRIMNFDENRENGVKNEINSLNKQETETKPETATDIETAETEARGETVTKQYECENVVQVAFRVAEMTNTYLDCQTWDEYCKEVKKVGSSWFDYTAFDSKGNECDVSILLGYDHQSRHYFVSVDYEKRPVSDFSSYECEKNFVNGRCYKTPCATETEPETATDTETTVAETATETKPETESETSELAKPLEIIFDDENSKPLIRTKFHLLETFSRLNINHYYVELMTDKRIGDFYLYLKFDENGNEEKAMCKIFHLNAEYRNMALETRFIYALAEKYNGIYYTPDYDDFAYYKKILEECKTPETFESFLASDEKCFYISPSEKTNSKSEINNKKSKINSIYGITANTSPEINNEYNETTELLAVEQFERLTGTLYKSLFKAIGIEKTRKIPFIISNNMVFFNYNGVQYKYYPSQCKIFKKCGRKYQRINWRDFSDDNSPTDQKQALGRSPPLLLI